MDDLYEKAHRDLYEALRVAGLTPQVAARRINAYYRASTQRVAAKLWEHAGSDGIWTDEEWHLRYAARWLGFKPADAAVKINGYEMRVGDWELNPYAEYAGYYDCWGFFGWIRGEFDRTRDIYNDPQVEMELPWQNVPDAPVRHVEVMGYGDSRGLALKIQWGRRRN